MNELSNAKKVRAAFKATQGIVEHEFEQRVIEASQIELNAMIERVASGETTFEDEDAVLLMKWRALNGKSE